MALSFCQIDVFNAFIDLLRQTGNVTKGSGGLANPSRFLFTSCFFNSSICNYDFSKFVRLDLSGLLEFGSSLPSSNPEQIDVNLLNQGGLIGC